MPRNETRLAYSTAQADQDIAAAERAVTMLEQLIERYVELPEILTLRAESHSATEVSMRSLPGPRSPVRTDVQSLIGQIDATAKTTHDWAAGELKVAGWISSTDRPDRTVARITHLARWAETLFRTRRHDTHARMAMLWKLNHRAGVLLGITARAFWIGEPCPYCKARTLWFDPEESLLRCAGPRCGYQAKVDSPLLVHISKSEDR